MPTQDHLHTARIKELVEQSTHLVKQCITPQGFLASPDNSDNYRRVWGRDGVIIGLAALMTDDEEMIEAFRETLLTLAAHQGPHGEIPSNVELRGGRVSYGGTTGRVDSDLWFIIGCGEYWQKTKDSRFLDKIMPVIDKIIFLLGAWEFNSRGLLYVPATGDWSDEYVHNGYILYDQLLYLQAQRTLYHLQSRGLNRKNDQLLKKIRKLDRMIRANYWFAPDNIEPGDIYHEVLYNKGRKAAKQCAGRYWLPFFTPHGYGYRFDAFANILSSLLGVCSSKRREAVSAYIEEHIVPDGMKMLPAFFPVIKPKDEDWEELKITFTYSFKNQPYEYHNGGLWPMISGFHIAEMVQHQETQKAWAYMADLYRANRMDLDGSPWSFPEFIHGRKFTPGGNRHQGWSASAALMGYYSLQGKKVFTINEDNSIMQ
ncbi:MAG: amylo-alpha-1,6-glucosidase [Desulforhopalus sp.]